MFTGLKGKGKVLKVELTSCSVTFLFAFSSNMVVVKTWRKDAR